jgi:hypothetical protein
MVSRGDHLRRKNIKTARRSAAASLTWAIESITNPQWASSLTSLRPVFVASHFLRMIAPPKTRGPTIFRSASPCQQIASFAIPDLQWVSLNFFFLRAFFARRIFLFVTDSVKIQNCPTGLSPRFDSLLLPTYSASQGSHAVFPHAARKLVMLMPVAFGIALDSLSARSHLAKLPGLQRTSLAMQDCLRTVFTAWRKARLENA